MQTIDLTKALSSYKSGWVAINKKNQVVAHAPTFNSISKKVKTHKDVVLIPAAKDYFGFITVIQWLNIHI